MTMQFNDEHFHRTFYELISYFNGYLDLFETYQVEAVVLSNYVYHFAIPMRIACQREIPAFQVTLETIYRLTKSRVHAYTEFLDYLISYKNSLGTFIQDLPYVMGRIQRRFSGKVGVDIA